VTRLIEVTYLASTALATIAVVTIAGVYAWRLRRAPGWVHHARDWHITLIALWALSQLARTVLAYVIHPEERQWRLLWGAVDNIVLYLSLLAIGRVVSDRVRFEARRDRREGD
jgi:hypothetical protein